jgi:hypothetical protein
MAERTPVQTQEMEHSMTVGRELNLLDSVAWFLDPAGGLDNLV